MRLCTESSIGKRHALELQCCKHSMDGKVGHKLFGDNVQLSYTTEPHGRLVDVSAAAPIWTCTMSASVMYYQYSKSMGPASIILFCFLLNHTSACVACQICSSALLQGDVVQFCCANAGPGAMGGKHAVDHA